MSEQRDKEDEELTIVEVDALPTDAEIAARQAAQDDLDDTGDDETGEDDDHKDGKEEGDERLSADQRDEDATPEGKRRKTSAEKRKAQREARDRTLKRLDFLEARNAELERQFGERLQVLETTTVATHKASLDEKLAATQTRLQEAEFILAKAIEAGNGEDAAQALRARDAARDEAVALESRKQEMDKPPPPRENPVADNLKSQWLAANASWFDGRNQESLVAMAIDKAVTADGFKPETPAYWEELTKRVKNVLAPSTTTQRRESRDPPRREGPPVGATREHAPASTRKEVYVTPERKQAMQDAGYWDDPKKRAQMLKRYADHDRDRRA